MEWQKQTEEMMEHWTSTQKQMWESWTEAMKGFSNGQNIEMWTKTVETWQEMVKGNMDSQRNFTKMWIESLEKMENVPPQFIEWVKQTEQMNGQWTDMQVKMWNDWFEMVKKVEPVDMSKMVNLDSQKTMFETWQNTVKSTMGTQAKMFESMMPAVKK